jgi:hypothetical protein
MINSYGLPAIRGRRITDYITGYWEPFTAKWSFDVVNADCFRVHRDLTADYSGRKHQKPLDDTDNYRPRTDRNSTNRRPSNRQLPRTGLSARLGLAHIYGSGVNTSK